MAFSIDVPAASAALTVNGTTAGVITVADTSAFYPGAEAWLSGTALTSKRVIITRILTGTTMQVRDIQEAGSNVNSLGYEPGGDMSVFTTVATSRIDMPGQCVRIDYSFTKHPMI